MPARVFGGNDLIISQWQASSFVLRLAICMICNMSAVQLSMCQPGVIVALC